MIRPVDPSWLARWLAQPAAPAVDVRGYLPATSVVHTAGSMIVWHPYSAAGCECFDDLARPVLDTDS